MKSNKVATTLQLILKQRFNASQKELTDIFKVKAQGGVSKRFISGNVTLDELHEMCKKYGYNFYAELSELLPPSIRDTYSNREYKSPVEEAILNLVRNKIK